jgi:hypothetical protein
MVCFVEKVLAKAKKMVVTMSRNRNIHATNEMTEHVHPRGFIFFPWGVVVEGSNFTILTFPMMFLMFP